MMMSKAPIRVGLFVTCLVDLFRPSVGLAAVKLLEDAGCVVEAPLRQTCCGQPAYNSGDRRDAKAIARQVIDLFEGYDYVVVPSGSCGGMLREHYPLLFADEPAMARRAEGLSARTFELVAFLTDKLGLERVDACFEGAVAYHDSCSCLRELKVRDQPRRLLSTVEGLTLAELANPEICCGFGGAFCVKYPEISTRMVDEKIEDIRASGARTLLAADLGCLMNIAGRLHREGDRIEVRHVAEVLAGMTDAPPIGGR